MSKPKSSFWGNEAVIRYFNALCDKSERPAVHWKKFRKLDKKNIFDKFTIGHLSLIRRQLTLKENGLCIVCGKKPPVRSDVCNDCLANRYQYFQNHLKKEKDNALAV